jgi:hypothetical protein
VQVIGARSVIYLSDPTADGRFVEREVRLGAANQDDVEVISGLQAGESIVVKGSFPLRAESERLGLRGPTALRPVDAGVRQRITVSERGFDPARVTLQAGTTARLTFVRTTDATCATEVAIPSLNIKRALPLNQPVDIEFTPERPGDVTFGCGMGMFSGTLVIR